ncbi:MAG: reverse transcriptase domain-containing protein, partial [Flavobacteriales bacterium]
GSDNYAHVVSWSTVRVFLVFCLLMGWKTSSIDFTNAFVQSILTTPVWIHHPKGFPGPRPNTCLQLNRSLYGLRRSPKLFFETASAAFVKLGFVPSSFDPCLLYRPGMLIVMYVDDCGIGAKDPAEIDQLVADLRNLGFDLTQEGDFTEFLGIKLTNNTDGTITLTQQGLIDKIVKAVHLETSNSVCTP